MWFSSSSNNCSLKRNEKLSFPNLTSSPSALVIHQADFSCGLGSELVPQRKKDGICPGSGLKANKDLSTGPCVSSWARSICAQKSSYFRQLFFSRSFRWFSDKDFSGSVSRPNTAVRLSAMNSATPPAFLGRVVCGQLNSFPFPFLSPTVSTGPCPTKLPVSSSAMIHRTALDLKAKLSRSFREIAKSYKCFSNMVKLRSVRGFRFRRDGKPRWNP